MWNSETHPIKCVLWKYNVMLEQLNKCIGMLRERIKRFIEIRIYSEIKEIQRKFLLIITLIKASTLEIRGSLCGFIDQPSVSFFDGLNDCVWSDMEFFMDVEGAIAGRALEQDFGTLLK